MGPGRGLLVHGTQLRSTGWQGPWWGGGGKGREAGTAPQPSDERGPWGDMAHWPGGSPAGREAGVSEQERRAVWLQVTAHLSGGDTDKRVIFLTVGTFQALVSASGVLLAFLQLQPPRSPLTWLVSGRKQRRGHCLLLPRAGRSLRAVGPRSHRQQAEGALSPAEKTGFPPRPRPRPTAYIRAGLLGIHARDLTCRG